MIGRLFWSGLLLAILDIYLLFRIGHALGLWPVLAILFLPAYFGLRAVMRQGLHCMNRISEEIQSGRNPSQKVAEAPVILVAGLLLLMPGPVSTVLGLLLMIPGLRRLIASRALLRTRKAGVVESEGSSSPNGGVFVRVVQIGESNPQRNPDGASAIKDAEGREVDGEASDEPKALPGPAPNGTD